jgi:hypothetical protein
MVQEAFLNFTHVSIDFTLKNFSSLLHFTGFNQIKDAKPEILIYEMARNKSCVYFQRQATRC